MRRLWPAALVAVVGAGYLLWHLSLHDWRASAIGELGTRFAEGNPTGTEGYDGQFTLYIAVQPDPASVVRHLDVPAYRYQRILLPVLGRVLALGQEDLIPWTLPLVNLAAHVLATGALAWALAEAGHWPGFALTYGLWVGVLGGLGLDLAEPLAYGLVALAWALRRARPETEPWLLGLSLFAKETTLPFFLAGLLGRGSRRAWREWLPWLAAASAFGLWQGWLWRTFGHWGLGSGGAMATPFEVIPFMGLLRVGMVDVRVLALYLVIFGPTVVLPTVWALKRTFGEIRGRVWDWEVLALGLNALVVMFLPFSTFREPFGLLRIATGLVLATLLYASSRRLRRTLHYSLFWMAFLVILVRH